MKKLFLSLILALPFGFVSLVASAQDLIILRNGDNIQAKVLTVRDNEIEYKVWANVNGPSYFKKASEVFMIKYENGYKDVLNATEPKERSVEATPKQNESVPVTEIQESVPEKKNDETIMTDGVTPRPDLGYKELIDLVHEANPYTLFKLGAEAEYCFTYNGEPTKFGGVATYLVQKIVDVKVQNGLYVAYFKQELYNKKHFPSKDIVKSYKEALYPTEIDVNGVFHWTHDIYREDVMVESKRGFAALISNDLNPDKPLLTDRIIKNCKNPLGIKSTAKYDYTGLRIVGYETITTPAGTFECLKISGTVMESYFGAAKSTDTIWFARGVGVVRHEVDFGSKKGPTIMYLNKLSNN